MPPYKRFYAGGPDTVRGYTEDTLGPVDTNGNPYGGNMLVVSRTELLLPVPEKWQTSARVSMFYDKGNVFSNDGTKYVGDGPARPPSITNSAIMRCGHSTGLCGAMAGAVAGHIPLQLWHCAQSAA